MLQRVECIPHICHFFYTDRIFENPNFTPKKTTKGTKNTKNVSEKVKYMHFFSLNLEKFTPDRKFLHRHVCGVCDKYEVWQALGTRKKIQNTSTQGDGKGSNWVRVSGV